MITQAELHYYLTYNPETGIFTNNIKRKRCNVGQKVGCINGKGYVNVVIQNKIYQAHRLAWLYVYGNIPSTLDHINGIRHDNKISNLRPATTQQNAHNTKLYSTNTSGIKSVTWNKLAKKWKVEMRVNGIKVFFGYFDDFFEACCKSISIRNSICGEFAFRPN